MLVVGVAVGLPQHVGLDVVGVSHLGQALLVLCDGGVHCSVEVAGVTEVYYSNFLPIFSKIK